LGASEGRIQAQSRALVKHVKRIVWYDAERGVFVIRDGRMLSIAGVMANVTPSRENNVISYKDGVGDNPVSITVPAEVRRFLPRSTAVTDSVIINPRLGNVDPLYGMTPLMTVAVLRGSSRSAVRLVALASFRGTTHSDTVHKTMVEAVLQDGTIRRVTTACTCHASRKAVCKHGVVLTGALAKFMSERLYEAIARMDLASIEHSSSESRVVGVLARVNEGYNDSRELLLTLAGIGHAVLDGISSNADAEVRAMHAEDASMDFDTLHNNNTLPTEYTPLVEYTTRYEEAGVGEEAIEFTPITLDESTSEDTAEVRRLVESINTFIGLPPSHSLGVAVAYALVSSAGFNTQVPVVNIVGRAGIGKTRLAMSLGRAVRRPVVEVRSISEDGADASVISIVTDYIGRRAGVDPSILRTTYGGIVREIAWTEAPVIKISVRGVSEGAARAILRLAREYGRAVAREEGGDGEPMYSVVIYSTTRRILRDEDLMRLVKSAPGGYDIDLNGRAVLTSVVVDKLDLMSLVGEDKYYEIIAKLRQAGYSIVERSVPSSVAVVSTPSFVGFEKYITARIDQGSGTMYTTNTILSRDIVLYDESMRGGRLEIVLTETSVRRPEYNHRMALMTNNPEPFVAVAVGELVPAVDRTLTVLVAEDDMSHLLRMMNAGATSIGEVDAERLYRVSRALAEAGRVYAAKLNMTSILAEAVMRALSTTYSIYKTQDGYVVPRGAAPKDIGNYPVATIDRMYRIAGGMRVPFYARELHLFLEAVLGVDRLKAMTGGVAMALHGKVIPISGDASYEDLLEANTSLLRKVAAYTVRLLYSDIDGTRLVDKLLEVRRHVLEGNEEAANDVIQEITDTVIGMTIDRGETLYAGLAVVEAARIVYREARHGGDAVEIDPY